MEINGRETFGHYLKARPKLLKLVEIISLDQLKVKLSTMGEEGTVWRDNSETQMNWSGMSDTLVFIAAIMAIIGKLEKHCRKSTNPPVLANVHKSERGGTN